MGAQQSSNRDEAVSTTKTCYYDLLSVDRHATDDEIKRAYRRKALELHPDRNINDVETATRKFAEVQSAYEILSDPQERAWYDSHRDAILSGIDSNDPDAQPTTFRNVRLTTAEEIMSLVRKFNPGIPFDDEPTGFYGIAAETFEHLALEEEAAAEFDNIDCPDYPSFGSSDDSYESGVKSFYSTWASFSTIKSFSWKDKYRLSDAPDRRVRRLMEKENKKLRDDAVREFNDAVRFLVSFVRKRDPRYLPNSQTDAERQISLRNAAAAQAARSRAANQEKLASFQIPEWAQSKNDEIEGEDNFTESEEEVEVEILECVVCNKTFKSENQLEAHERSKKHIKATQQLRRQMQREGVNLELDAEASPSRSRPDEVSETDEASDTAKGQDEVLSPPATNPPLEVSSLTDSAATSDSDDYAPRSTIEERIMDDKSTHGAVDETLASLTKDLEVEEVAPQPKKIGKAKAKRERKAAAQAQQNSAHRCTVCGETYTSRSKLFDHIRLQDHAAPVAKQASSNKKKR